MAIRMMTYSEKADQPNVEVVTNFFGHETNRVAHKYDCPHMGKAGHITLAEGETVAPCGCKTYGPLYMETTYVGRVLETRERNGRDDSDFYAIVWDDETDAPKHVEYASTRGWTYPNSATVDATPEVRAKYEAYCARAREIARQAEAEAQARRVEKGKQVRVIGGRKHKGKEGEVFWVGVNGFRTYYRNGYNRPEDAHNQRVGVRPADGGEAFFLPLTQVEVILPEAATA